MDLRHLRRASVHVHADCCCGEEADAAVREWVMQRSPQNAQNAETLKSSTNRENGPCGPSAAAIAMDCDYYHHYAPPDADRGLETRLSASVAQRASRSKATRKSCMAKCCDGSASANLR